ncbi:MAG: flagellar hook-basal body complex protein [Gracilibacteraceae bacterium]|jgi:flagellar hook protein FlgE|nr:flagellar hook-basal body complex protein [Gracilibacteraceae bacterium]
MMRSMYSAVTGLRNHQIAMDVIGNNIANVNTIGYKRSKTSFATMLSQNLSGAAAPDNLNSPPTFGGINPIQVGLGMSISSIDRIMNQGAAQNTGKATDMMVQDDGFFVVRLGSDIFYTRTGNFDFDRDGNLVDPSTGALVQGYANSTLQGTSPAPVAPSWGTATGSMNIKLGMDHPDLAGFTLSGFTIDKKGVITGIYSDGTQSITEQLYMISLANFSNPGGLMAMGNNFYAPSNNSGAASVGKPGENGLGTIIPGALEMSNVELAQEFTDMIVTQRGFQANSRVITVSDSLLQELIDLKR